MNKDFWKAAAIRAIKTICQTAIATIGSAMVITDVNWVYVLSASALAGILSILTSLSAGLPEVQLANTLYDLDNMADEDYMEEYHALDEEEVDEDETEEAELWHFLKKKLVSNTLRSLDLANTTRPI